MKKNKVTKMNDKWLSIFIVLNIIAVTMHVLMLLTHQVQVLHVYISLLALACCWTKRLLFQSFSALIYLHCSSSKGTNVQVASHSFKGV